MKKKTKLKSRVKLEIFPLDLKSDKKRIKLGKEKCS